MYNRRYDKVFIMLRQELNGFSMGQQPAWGSCIMELKNKKGKLFVTVQGLKKLADDRTYEFFVIGGMGTAMRGVSCGNIFVDQYGKGELKWEFDPDAIGQSCFCVEQLHTVALLVKGGYGLTAPLAGYFKEKVSWQRQFQEEKEKKDLRAAEAILAQPPKKENKTEKSEQKKEEKITQIHKQDMQETKKEMEKQKTESQNFITIEDIRKEVKKKEEKTESVFQKNFKNMLLNFKKELEQLEQKGVLTQEDRKKIAQADAITVKKEETSVVADKKDLNENKEQASVVADKKDLNENKEQASVVTNKKDWNENKEQASVVADKKDLNENKEITYILEHNDDIYPFEEKDRWKSIALEELAILPLDALKMMHHSFFILAYRKYKHFIFQKTAEGEYYIGVPDQYQPQTRREAQQLLFSTFEPCKKETMKVGCYGYWIRKMKGE